MAEFRTIIPITPLTRKIDFSHRILSLGSCFADNIAKRLAMAKFSVTASPTGILFNPASIASAIERYASAEIPTIEDLQFDNERWFSLDFHSSFSYADSDTTLMTMRHGVEQGAAALRNSDTYIITFGTAIVYRLSESGQVVANCHKQPQRLFRREMLSVEEIVSQYSTLMEGLLRDKNVIFTVSPIRHLSEGAEENSLSKATLRVAIGEIIRRYANAAYFPSFEIMNDELRDYRFYTDDMTHPSSVAIDYIWLRFSEAAFSDATLSTIKRIERIVAATEHRPFNPQSEAHRTFCRKQLKEIDDIKQLLDHIDLEKEKSYFEGFL